MKLADKQRLIILFKQGSRIATLTEHFRVSSELYRDLTTDDVEEVIRDFMNGKFMLVAKR